MKYVQPVGAVEDAPYIDASPAAGIEGSPVPAAAIEHPMREIMTVIEEAGLIPDGGDLTQLWQAILRARQRDLDLLDYPTVLSAGNTVGASVESLAGMGGRVTVPAGVRIDMGAPVTAETGRMGEFATQDPAWSADLEADATYYLRAQVVDGALVLYVQQGADTDATPASRMGSPDAVAGGGFDSTRLDALLARIVTGAAGTMPAITELANKRRLEAVVLQAIQGPSSLPSQSYDNFWGDVIDINWARTPQHFTAIQEVGSNPELSGGGSVNGSTIDRYSARIWAEVANFYNASISNVVVNVRVHLFTD